MIGMDWVEGGTRDDVDFRVWMIESRGCREHTEAYQGEVSLGSQEAEFAPAGLEAMKGFPGASALGD